jgi:beta-lactam-binding protein with PASTA domain
MGNSTSPLKFLMSRTFLKNVLIFCIVFIAGFFSVSGFLNFYTHHGQNIAVPNLKGLKLTSLKSILIQHHFSYKVVDSLYDSERPPGTILDQDPAAESKVKEGRTIYLTINSVLPPDVKMPDLVDVSFRQAEAILQSYGLVAGDVTYRTDLAKNAVLEQRYKNTIIKPGRMIPKGSQIDLVLGDGMATMEVSIPDLTGLTRSEAWSVLKRASLTVGSITYDENVKDTLNAKIYSQRPLPGDDSLNAGDPVDLFLH